MLVHNFVGASMFKAVREYFLLTTNLIVAES